MMSQNDKSNSEFSTDNIISSGNDLSESKEQSTNFTVQNTAGEIVSINVNRRETVENLQAKIENQFGIPSNKQIFSCFGESTLWSGNDGMQQTFSDLNEVRANVNEMKSDLENKYDKAQRKIDELSNQITKLTKEIAKILNDKSRICRIKDVRIDYEIDYELLNGKILEIDKLYKKYDEKWLADGYKISFENSDFVVYPKELCVFSHSNLSSNFFNRIICNNLKVLDLFDATITYSDYKKMTTSQKLGELNLCRVTVFYENGKKVEIDKLLEEAKYVNFLAYQFNDGEATSETAQKLVELPPFPNLRTFCLQKIQEGFDLKTFGDFLKKNPTIVNCELHFICSDKFYEEVKRAQNDLLPTLPSTCKLVIKK